MLYFCLENVHFKPNIQLISGKTDVYSVLSNQGAGEESSQPSFNPPSLFSNNVQSAETVPHEMGNNERIVGESQNLSFTSMSNRNQEPNENSSSNISTAFPDGDTAPTIFSAPLNSANLLSSGATEQSATASTSKETGLESNTGGQTFNHSINTSTGAVQHQLIYSQTSSNVQYTQQNQTSTAYQVYR
jgi:hypothetical protein